MPDMPINYLMSFVYNTNLFGVCRLLGLFEGRIYSQDLFIIFRFCLLRKDGNWKELGKWKWCFKNIIFIKMGDCVYVL